MATNFSNYINIAPGEGISEEELEKLKRRGWTERRGRDWVSRKTLENGTEVWDVSDDVTQEEIEGLVEKDEAGNWVKDTRFEDRYNDQNPRYKTKKPIDENDRFLIPPQRNPEKEEWLQIQIKKDRAIAHGFDEIKDDEAIQLETVEHLVVHAQEAWPGKAIEIHGSPEFMEAVWYAAQKLDTDPRVVISGYDPDPAKQAEIMKKWDAVANARKEGEDKKEKKEEEKKEENTQPNPKPETPEESEQTEAKEGLAEFFERMDNEAKTAEDSNKSETPTATPPQTPTMPAVQNRAFGSPRSPTPRTAKVPPKRRKVGDNKKEFEAETSPRTPLALPEGKPAMSDVPAALPEGQEKPEFPIKPELGEHSEAKETTRSELEVKNRKEENTQPNPEPETPDAKTVEASNKSGMPTDAEKKAAEEKAAQDRFGKTGYGYDPDAKQKNEARARKLEAKKKEEARRAEMEARSTKIRKNNTYGSKPDAEKPKLPEKFGTNSYYARKTSVNYSEIDPREKKVPSDKGEWKPMTPNYKTGMTEYDHGKEVPGVTRAKTEFGNGSVLPGVPVGQKKQQTPGPKKPKGPQGPI
ncbi:MAG: hypothetical protein PHW76_06850 [Alphaproteobacteria bacterium]|nr:hypothetical protein [Alphaproteobacteria bacterium]